MEIQILSCKFQKIYEIYKIFILMSLHFYPILFSYPPSRATYLDLHDETLVYFFRLVAVFEQIVRIPKMGQIKHPNIIQKEQMIKLNT